MAAPSLVQNSDINNGATSPYTRHFTAPSDAGNTVIVALNVQSAWLTYSVTDNYGNAYLPVSAPVWGQGALGCCAVSIFVATGIDAGAGAIAVSYAFVQIDGGPNGSVEASQWEAAGIDLANPVDAFVAGVGVDGGTTMDSGSLVTTSPGDLLFAWGLSFQNTLDAGPGYAFLSNVGSDIVEGAIAATPGTYSAAAVTNSPAWVIGLVAFRAAAVADAGAGDAGAGDAGAADAGSDAGFGDAGGGLDGGPVRTSPTHDRVGCDCASGASRGALAWWALLGVAFGRLLQRRPRVGYEASHETD